MRLLLILEMHFIQYRDKVYTEVTADFNFWSRYLDVFDKITVCARMSRADDNFEPSKYLLSSRKNVNFVGLPEFKGVNGLAKNYFKTKKIFRKSIKNCDCAIFRVPSPISLVAYPIIRKSGKPFAIELMMNPYTAHSKAAINHPLQPIIQYIITRQTKKACLTANGVAYVTEKVLQELYPCKAILNDKNTDRYFTASYSTITLNNEDIFFKDWDKKKSEDPIVLIHSGKMENYRKGQIVFLNIIKKLLNRGRNVEAIIIGDGSKRSEFIRLAEKLDILSNVEFTGWLSGFEEVKKVLRRGDIFVFPTVGEGLPRTIIEAMANGLVCVSSPVDGVLELIDTNLLADYNDIDKFVNIIENLIDNPKLMKKISEDNVIKAQSYTEDKLQIRRRKFYTNLFNVSTLK